MGITVFICTHNRSHLLRQAIDSVNAATPPSQPVEILVVANNCTDDTEAYLTECANRSDQRFPLRWVAEPTPGKSHALNRGIPVLKTSLIACIDDDHRVDSEFLREIERAARTYPDVDIYCGPVQPDWTGAEPSWVHDEGPYRIYPLPVPRYDLGPNSILVTEHEGPLPGGGNIILKREVFDLVGAFSTDLGPNGHDLGGGEDIEYVTRALRLGARVRYVPSILQFHFADPTRLTLRYILRKSFQRTRASAKLRYAGRGVQRFIWRKLFEYLVRATTSLSRQQRRFYLVRVAASLGEIRGMLEARRFSPDVSHSRKAPHTAGS